MKMSNDSTSVNEVFTPEHTLKHKRRNQNKKTPVWHPRKQPHSSTSPAYSNSQPTRKHSTGFSPDTPATNRSSPSQHQSHSTSGFSALSWTGSRRLKNLSQSELAARASEIDSMSLTSTIVTVFVIGLVAALAGYCSGYYARGVEELGKKHGGVQYILPQNSPSPVVLQRVSI
jgi:hypothetical protein